MLLLKNKIKLFFPLSAFAVIYIKLDCALALRCYTCTYIDSNPDKSCIAPPDSNSQRTTFCSMKYCTIQRQESLNPPGKVISFIRGCENKPLYLNDVLTDSMYKNYFRSCTTDLCNNGDGIQTTSNADPSFGAGENLLVEGKTSAAASKQLKTNFIAGYFTFYIILFLLKSKLY